LSKAEFIYAVWIRLS